jgi:succinyl-CoA synthetase alpha subunit
MFNARKAKDATTLARACMIYYEKPKVMRAIKKAANNGKDNIIYNLPEDLPFKDALGLIYDLEEAGFVVAELDKSNFRHMHIKW